MGDFMQRLNDTIEKKGLNNYSLAKKLGVSEGTIRFWRNGRIPRGDRLQQLSDVLEVSSRWLLSGEKAYEPTIHDDVLRVVEKLEDFGKKDPEGYKRAKEILMIMMGEESGEGEGHTISGGRKKETGHHKKKSA
jgi:transcriptional regulator with XRE-family HTH domain